MIIEIINNTQNSDLSKEDFNKECDVIDQLEEYHEGFFGPRWLIATCLSEDELLEKFPSIMADYDDFMIVTPEVGAFFKKNKRENDKYRKRVIRNGDISFEQGITDQVFSECWVDNCSVVEGKKAKSKEQRKLIDKAINEFPESSKRRFKKKYYDKMSPKEIAKAEKVDRSAIDHSMKLCREITIKVFDSSDFIKVVRSNGIVKEVRI